MPQHFWGEDFDFKGVEDAANFIGDYCAKWGRCYGQCKEKFGESRCYINFGFNLHQLIWPKSFWRKHDKCPQWLWNLSYMSSYPFLSKTVGRIWCKWQVYIYSRAYHLAIKKWPHLRAEILCGADHPELIKGVTKQVYNGKDYELQILGWDGEKVGGWLCNKPWFDEKGKLIK